MALFRKKKTTVDNIVEPMNPPVIDVQDAHVIQHLDRDPNDPRNHPENPPLPSLDD